MITLKQFLLLFIPPIILAVDNFSFEVFASSMLLNISETILVTSFSLIVSIIILKIGSMLSGNKYTVTWKKAIVLAVLIGFIMYD